MKVWKSSLVFLLALCLLMILASCGGQAENGIENDDNPMDEMEEFEELEEEDGSAWEGIDVISEEWDDDYIQINLTNNSGQPWFLTFYYYGEVIITGDHSWAWKAEDFVLEPGETHYDSFNVDYGRSLGSFFGSSQSNFTVSIRFVESIKEPGPDGKYHASTDGYDVNFHDLRLRGTYGESINIEWTGSTFRKGEEPVIEW